VDIGKFLHHQSQVESFHERPTMPRSVFPQVGALLCPDADPELGETAEKVVQCADTAPRRTPPQWGVTQTDYGRKRPRPACGIRAGPGRKASDRNRVRAILDQPRLLTQVSPSLSLLVLSGQVVFDQVTPLKRAPVKVARSMSALVRLAWVKVALSMAADERLAPSI
jgi:hypothetical protein